MKLRLTTWKSEPDFASAVAVALRGYERKRLLEVLEKDPQTEAPRWRYSFGLALLMLDVTGVANVEVPKLLGTWPAVPNSSSCPPTTALSTQTMLSASMPQRQETGQSRPAPKLCPGG